jgi:GT2 family glycosyltransferase
MSLNDGRCPAESLLRVTIDKHGQAIARHLLSDGLAIGMRPVEFDIGDLVRVPHPVYSGPLPTVTVAVCTRDRTADLKRCLDFLTLVNYPGLEIVVVDNAPSDESTERLVHDYPYIRYVREPRPGLDWARNRAILEARGEIIAYTDDDVVVDPAWVSSLAAVFAQEPEAMAVTGLVIPYELETEAQVLFEEVGGFGRGFRRKWYRAGDAKNTQIARLHGGAGKVGTGANMAYRRNLFNHIGFFDPALDMGTPTNGGGDLNMFFRVIKEGHTLVYEPSAIVRHVHRRDPEALQSQMFSWGTGFSSYVISSSLAYPHETVGFIRLGLRWFLERSVRRFSISLVRQSLSIKSLVIAESWGFLTGVLRYFRARSITKNVKEKFGPLTHVGLCASRNYKGKVLKKKGDLTVRKVDLYQGPKKLADVADYPSTRVFVTRGNHIIGHLDIANEHGMVSAPRLCDAIVHAFSLDLLSESDISSLDFVAAKTLTMLKRHYGEANGRSISGTSQRLPVDISVSVVIATYDRPDLLRKCLRSLSGQQTSRVVEIIVVDNHPASHLTPPVVAAFPEVVLVNELRRGLSYARNAGIVASKGEIVVATDDDVSMPSDWLEKLIAPFVRNDVMIVTGNVLPIELETPAQQLFEVYGGLQRGFQRREADGHWFESFRRRAVPTWELGSTANAAFRTGLFSDPRVGLFDEALGAGMATGCSEDTYLFYKVLKAGYTHVYEPEAYVWHQHRRDISALRRQIYSYSKGHVAYHLTTLIRDHDRRSLLRLMVDLPRWHLRRIKQWVRGRRNYPLSLIVTEIAGHVVGPFALWRSRRRVKREGRSDPYSPTKICDSCQLLKSDIGAQAIANSSPVP